MKPLKKSEVNWLPIEEDKEYPVGFYYVSANPYRDKDEWACIDTRPNGITTWTHYAPVFNFPKWRDPKEAEIWMEVLILFNGKVFNGFKNEVSSYIVRLNFESNRLVDIDKIDGWLPISELADLIQAPDPIEEEPEQEKEIIAVIPLYGVDIEVKLKPDPNNPERFIPV